MKTTAIISIIISFLFSQANYQILNSPSSFNEIFKNNKIEDINYGVFHTSYPAQIDSYSILASLNNIFKEDKYNFYFNFQSLDYGIIKDNITNYSFTANENVIKIIMVYEIDDNVKSMLNFGFLDSDIDQYNSNALFIDGAVSYQFLDNIINLKIKNWGNITKKYTDSNIELPSIVSLSYTRKFKPLEIIMNYEYDINLKEDLYSIASKFNINNNLRLYLGANSNKKNIIYGNYIEELISGIRMGLSFEYSDYIFYLAVQNMGAAGYANSISFQKIIL